MSRKFIFSTFSFLAFLLLLSSVMSQDVKILSPDSSIIIYAGITNEIKIPIKNEGTQGDSVYISIWPGQWISVDKYWLTLNSGESQLISLLITPPETAEEGVYVFTVTTQSLNFNKTTTKSLYLDVKRKTNIFISQIKLDKQIVNPKDTLEIESVLTNLHKTQKQKVYLTTKILDNGLIIKTFEETLDLDPKTVKSIKNFYEVDKLQKYGDYGIEVELRDSLNIFLDKEETNFKIEKNFEMIEQKTREYGIFYTTIVIEVTNEGNIPNSNYTITESLPKIIQNFFYPENEPDKEEIKDNRVVYTWVLEGLEPGQTKTVRYKLRFINVLIAVLIFVILVILTYQYLTRPLLGKRYLGILSGEKELKIMLSAVNRGRKPLKNVVVKDFVSPLARVIKEFDTLEPEINVRSSGTELIWKIEKIRPREEIFLTYKIKPLIDVIGKLNLPKSYFTYDSRFGRKRNVVSKSISIIGKIK